MIGAAPPHISVVRPLKDGVISDFGMTSMMLKSFIGRVVPTSSFFTSVRVVIGVPSGVTEVEKRAVEEVTRQMGAKEVYIMEEPMAAAIGVGLDVDSPTGCMITDIGGGTADIAIIFPGRHRYQHLSEDGRGQDERSDHQLYPQNVRSSDR